MNPQPFSSLPSTAGSTGADELLIVIGGVYHRIPVAGLRDALPIATTSYRGMLSAADKQNLDNILSQVSALIAPQTTPIVAASSITVPANRYFITLSGTTEITQILGMTPRKPYTFYYPSGAGVTIMGNKMLAGDVLQLIDV